MPRRTVATHGPDPIDVYVGSRIRLQRTLMGLSQTDVAESMGLTFQQLQKYEKGVNRVSASKLWIMAGVLKVPVGFFFEGIATGSDQPSRASQEITTRWVLECAKDMNELPPEVRDYAAKIIKQLAKAFRAVERVVA